MMMQTNADRALKSNQMQAQNTVFRNGQKLQGKVRILMRESEASDTPDLGKLMLCYGLVSQYVSMRNDISRLLHIDRLTQEMGGLQSKLKKQLVELGVDEKLLLSTQRMI